MRVPSTVDRRLVDLELTPAGKTLMERLYPEFNAIESKVVADLSPRQMTMLTNSLRRIVETTERL